MFLVSITVWGIVEVHFTDRLSYKVSVQQISRLSHPRRWYSLDFLSFVLWWWYCCWWLFLFQRIEKYQKLHISLFVVIVWWSHKFHMPVNWFSVWCIAIKLCSPFWFFWLPNYHFVKCRDQLEVPERPVYSLSKSEFMNKVYCADCQVLFWIL